MGIWRYIGGGRVDRAERDVDRDRADDADGVTGGKVFRSRA